MAISPRLVAKIEAESPTQRLAVSSSSPRCCGRQILGLVRDRADLFAVEERMVAGTEARDIYVRGR